MQICETAGQIATHQALMPRTIWQLRGCVQHCLGGGKDCAAGRLPETRRTFPYSREPTWIGKAELKATSVTVCELSPKARI